MNQEIYKPENSDVAINRNPTIDDVHILAQRCENVMNHVAGTVENVAVTIRQIREISAQVELATAQMEKEIDALMIKCQRDIRLYEQSLPLLDKQFEAQQNRMDRLMDQAVNMMTGDFTDESIARQEAMLKLIELTNDGLNRLMAKLIPQY